MCIISKVQHNEPNAGPLIQYKDDGDAALKEWLGERARVHFMCHTDSVIVEAS